jgi:hypothetical protein
MVEIFFGIITRQAIRRGSFASVRDLITQSEPSLTNGTTAASPSSGPKQPTSYSRTATQVRELRSATLRISVRLLSGLAPFTYGWIGAPAKGALWPLWHVQGAGCVVTAAASRGPVTSIA